MTPPASITLLVSRRFGAGRALIRGILDGLGDRRRWLIDLQEPWPGDRLHQALGSAPAGLIVTAQQPAGLEALAASGVPAICIGDPGEVPLPAVGCDHDAVAELAVGHFQELRCGHLAWLGFRGEAYAASLGAAVGRAATRAGSPCLAAGETEQPDAQGTGIQPGDATDRWLTGLPAGTGLICANDRCAWEVLKACRRQGLPVPDRLAVLGCNNDDLLCEVAEPPLSSIDAGEHQLGRLAASLLVKALAGGQVEPGLRHVPPRGLVPRQSSAVVAVDDDLVRWAVNWIRAHIDGHLTIKRLVYEAGVSRRTLEERFRHHLGRTPLAEIHRQQIAVARMLLVVQGLTPTEVVARLGLSSTQQLNRLCKKHLGKVPSELLQP